MIGNPIEDSFFSEVSTRCHLHLHSLPGAWVQTRSMERSPPRIETEKTPGALKPRRRHRRRGALKPRRCRRRRLRSTRDAVSPPVRWVQGGQPPRHAKTLITAISAAPLHHALLAPGLPPIAALHLCSAPRTSCPLPGLPPISATPCSAHALLAPGLPPIAKLLHL